MSLLRTETTIVAGPGGVGDITWLSLRRRHGRADAAALLSDLRESYDGPLLVEPFSALDLPAVAEHADGVLVGGAWMQDFQLLRAVARTGRPVVVQRAPAATLEEWLGAGEYCVAEGNHDVVLCETGTRTHLPHATIDLALVREARKRWPTLVDVSAAPDLAVAALSVGADGLILGEDDAPELVAEVRAKAAVLGPLVRDTHAENIPNARAAIDRVDAALATLLERRAELAGVIQNLKPVGGFAGRDPRREREIVEAMALRAPTLGPDRLARIMTAVIEAGLDLHARDLTRA